MTRQPDFSTSPRPATVPIWRSLVLAAGLLAALAAGISALRARAEAAGAQRRLVEVRRELDSGSARLEALESRARAAAGGTLAPDAAPPARILSDVARALPGDVRLERLSIDYRRGGALELAVVARDASAWDRLLRQLEAAPRLRAVAPGPEERSAEVRSVVRARWTSERR